MTTTINGMRYYGNFAPLETTDLRLTRIEALLGQILKALQHVA